MQAPRGAAGGAPEVPSTQARHCLWAAPTLLSACLWAESCLSPPQNSYAEVLTSSTGEQATIWTQGLCRSNQVKKRSSKWVLIQYERCPYRKGKCGHGRTLGEDAM